jgi:hypothetical protein
MWVLRRWVAAVALTAAFVTPALAQTCGDADGSGAVSVTDGVQVLRSAAGLDDDCPTPLCDMDGSSAVTVTDGVNVLRLAAGLSVDPRCPVLSAQEKQVFGALRKTVQVTGILAVGVDAAGSGAASVTGAAAVPCPGGGSADASGSTVTYDECRVRGTVCSGTAALVDGEFQPALTCNDLTNAQSFDLGGSVVPSTNALGRVITGSATGTQGTSQVFQFDYDQLPLAANARGGRAAGGLNVNGAFFAGAFERVEMSFPGRNPETGEPDPNFVKIVGIRNGGGGVLFVFVFDQNLDTGKLTAR